MVRLAASAYIVTNGPVTGQDRWEEDGGFSSFTLAVEISALLAAADARRRHRARAQEAAYMRDTADLWNGQIEHWIYATDTTLAPERRRARLLRPGSRRQRRPMPHLPSDPALSPSRTSPPEDSRFRASLLVSPDAPRAGAVRAARARRSAHPGHHHGDRRPAQGRFAGRPLLAALTATVTATVNTKTARRSTARASAGPGRCSPASAPITHWPRATSRKQRRCWRP